MSAPEPGKPGAAAKPCPICGKPAEPKYAPFCSARCADVDLNRWFNGAYSVPVSDEPDEGDGNAP